MSFRLLQYFILFFKKKQQNERLHISNNTVYASNVEYCLCTAGISAGPLTSQMEAVGELDVPFVFLLIKVLMHRISPAPSFTPSQFYSTSRLSTY